MSLEAMRHVWSRKCPSSGYKLLLLAIADMCDDKRFECWPSVHFLCLKTQLDRRHVRRLLHRMEKAGEIRIKAGCGRSVSRYTYLFKTETLFSELGAEAVVSIEERGSVDPLREGLATMSEGVCGPSESSGIQQEAIMRRVSTSSSRRGKGDGGQERMTLLAVEEAPEAAKLRLLRQQYEAMKAAGGI